MLPHIKEYEPPKRRLRIKNRIRLAIFLLFILLAFLLIFIPNIGAGQVNYKPYTVVYGDTYWNIAKELQQNGYRSRDDIRNVVDELIQKSGIKAHELKEGDVIYVPAID